MAIDGGRYGTAPAPDEPGTLYCANHPNVPTNLRCSRCGKPICARCRIATPVGYRCHECAAVQVVPTYAVGSSNLVRSGALGFATAGAIGVLWGLLPGFAFWAALIMGLVVGEVVSAAANMKRGPGLQMIGLAAVVFGILVSRAVLQVVLTSAGLYDFLSRIPGNAFPASWLQFDLLGLLIMALAAGLAWYRLR